MESWLSFWATQASPLQLSDKAGRDKVPRLPVPGGPIPKKVDTDKLLSWNKRKSQSAGGRNEGDGTSGEYGNRTAAPEGLVEAIAGIIRQPEMF